MTSLINDEDLHTISFDKIYPSGNSWYALNDTEKLLTNNSNNYCENICCCCKSNNNENNMLYSCIKKLVDCILNSTAFICYSK